MLLLSIIYFLIYICTYIAMYVCIYVPAYLFTSKDEKAAKGLSTLIMLPLSSAVLAYTLALWNPLALTIG